MTDQGPPASRLAERPNGVFDQELKYFVAHQNELVAAYSGKVLILRGEKVEGAYKSALEAYESARKQFPIGTFMIQPCQPGPRAYTVTISSMNGVAALSAAEARNKELESIADELAQAAVATGAARKRAEARNTALEAALVVPVSYWEESLLCMSSDEHDTDLYRFWRMWLDEVAALSSSVPADPETQEHDAECESELTSHGYTPCRCVERAASPTQERDPR